MSGPNQHKRLSFSASPGTQQKRRSVTLNPWRHSQTPISAPVTPITATDQALDDVKAISRTNSPNLMNMRSAAKEQDAEIQRLRNENAELRGHLKSRPTEEDVNNMRKEWETSEELFARSQKDNEQKHATIEHMKQYIKALESKLEETLGSGWRECCTLPPMPSRSTSFASSTLLPQPGQMSVNRNSTSNRASRTSRNVALEASRLRDLRELGTECETTNPSTALRKLEGITERNISPLFSASVHSTGSTTDCLEVDGLIDSPRSLINPPSLKSLRETISSPSPTPLAMRPQADARALADIVNLIQALPATLRMNNDDERALERTRIEEQKLAVLDMLDAAEQRADAREIRLQNMLAEAKACSGQMGW